MVLLTALKQKNLLQDLRRQKAITYPKKRATLHRCVCHAHRKVSELVAGGDYKRICDKLA